MRISPRVLAMITVRKLRTLEPKTRLRKCSAIFHNAAFRQEEHSYLLELLPVIGEACGQIEGLDAARLQNLCRQDLSPTVCSDICYEILRVLGAEPADWDFVSSDGVLDGSAREVLGITLVLDRIRSPFNVGSILRSSDSFGVREVILVEGTASPEHNRAQRTSRGTDHTVPWRYAGESEVLELLSGSKLPSIALELGGDQIGSFSFPREGFAVIGSEEFGVSPALLQACTNRVSIPLSGSKGSLNVSVATGIFLFSWYSRLVRA